jgi:DNA-binding GntR family transcriptional regulator
MKSPIDIADELRTDILELRLEPGQPLREMVLAERFDASRRSVREALLVLSAERIVDHERNRGAVVRTFTADDVRDLYRVRRVLESEGARNSVTASDEQLQEVNRALAALLEAADGTHESTHALRDMQFHASVIALAGSARIDRFFEQLSVEMAYAIRLLLRDELDATTDSQLDVARHRAIAASLNDRDAVGAQRAILEHIDENEARLLRLLEG